MPYVTFLEQYTKEKLQNQLRDEGQIEGLLEAIEAVLDVRFPDVTADLMLQVRQVEDLNKLHELLEAVKSADPITIQSAIHSAVPPPK